MRRRGFIALMAGAAFAMPLGAAAEPSNEVRKIGVLMPIMETDPEAQLRLTAFRQGLQARGWTDGQNVRITYRWTIDPDRMRSYARELIDLAPDVILVTSNPALAALRQETRTVPIVFVGVADPVGSGLIESLARPGGNITGFTNFEPSVAGKWMELLKEVAPTLTRVAVVLHPETPANLAFLRATQAAASSLGVTLTVAGVHDAVEIEDAITRFAAEPNGGLIIVPHPVTSSHREQLLKLAEDGRLPAIAAWKYLASHGALISYGLDLTEEYRRAASYIDRILKGGKPGNLPVQAPTKFELVINMKTAKKLDLNVPLHLQQLADEVIE
jgi:putative ABC transport system substrate-binding protein